MLPESFLELASTPEGLSAAAGMALSLLLSYVPRLNVRWATLPEDTKKAAIAVLMVVIATVVMIASPEGFDFMRWATSVVSALVVNQNVHRVSPQTEAVKKAKQKKQRGTRRSTKSTSKVTV